VDDQFGIHSTLTVVQSMSERRWCSATAGSD
jgi:hypothetical protein